MLKNVLEVFFVDFAVKHHHIKNLYRDYLLLFLVVAACMFGTYLLSGHSLIWRLDGANQHLPLLENFRRGLGQLLSGHTHSLSQWSYQMGLGTDNFSVYSYYLLGDIFAYLTLLFPVAQVVTVYQWLIVLRLFCAGLAFLFLASHFNFSKNALLTGSLVYMFNAFLLYSAAAQPFFTTPFIIFPLLILGVEKILQGRSAWPLTDAFIWMLVSNYYFAFVLGLGTLLYLVLRVGFYYLHDLNYWQALGKLAWATVTSLLVSAVMLVPEIIAVTHSTRAASSFANGLKLYPLYYYLALPAQLINGGNRDFYFWSALGYASLVFFALIFVCGHCRKYPLLTTTFGLSFVMLLFPFFGALFNGGMAPSNRWTLLLCLPLALATCVLVQELRQLTDRTIKLFAGGLGIYALVIAVTYYFQNDEKIFIPFIFLFVSLAALLLVHFRTVRDPQRFLLWVVLANVSLNAIYFAAPYNGGYANEMLPTKTYQQLRHQTYAGLADKLAPVQKSGYRISTTSENFDLGGGYHLYNSLPSQATSISSYYSVQNQFVGDFSEQMGNIQYDANVPLRQVDDRTILSNFLGVRYIFNWLNQDNFKKIPANYYLDKMSPLVTDPNGNHQHDQQARRYKSDQALPLFYWQDHVFTASQQRHYTVSQKERALISGVKVSSKAAHNLPPASVKGQTFNLPYRLISSRGNEVDPHHLTKEDSQETYQLVLPRDLPDYYPDSELHLEFSKLTYRPDSLKDQIKLEQLHQKSQGMSGLLGQNDRYNYYKYLRYHVLQGSPDSSFKLKVSSALGTETIDQPKQSTLSFYKNVTDGMMNVGYFKQSLPQAVTLTPTKLGHYSFDLKVVAVPLGKDSAYGQQVKQLQHQRLRHLKLTPDKITGSITTKKPGILTSTIPYSSGWQVKVNGQKQPVLRTNTAFLGVKLGRGTHHVTFSYHLPGIKLGSTLSLAGLALLALGLLGTWLTRPRRQH